MNRSYLLLLVVLFFFSFDLFETPSTKAAEKSILKFRAGYTTPSTDNILLPIAQKQGFFNRYGIEVEVIALRGGVQTAQALLSDSLQFAQLGGAVLVQSVLSGADLAMIAGFVDRISYFLISKPEIRDVKGLVGKKIATASIGGSVDTVLRLGLKASGVDPKSVAFFVTGDPQTRVAAVISGYMDATIVPAENLAAVEKAGVKVVKDLSELDVFIQHLGLVAKRSLIREKRAAVKSFLNAIMDSIDFYRTHEQQTLDILAKFTSIKDRQALKYSYDYHKKLFPQPPYPSRDGFNTLIVEVADKSTITRNVSPEMFFDRTLLDELRKK